MSSNYKPNKGYIMSLEALICLAILTVSLAQVQIKPKPDLNEELTYQLTQDIVETCIKNNTPNKKCFSKITKINPHITLDKKGNITFTRKIDGEKNNITFKLS